MSELSFRVVACIMCALALAGSDIGAQQVAPEFAHGVDYTFSRAYAKRQVDDAFDRGTLRLVAYVYRPVKLDRHQVVLFSHGSTGGWTISPREPDGTEPPVAVIRFFMQRGYTVVAPMRRGVNESSGHYLEECEYQAGKCTLEQNTALFDLGLREAALDSMAVIDQIIEGRLVPKNTPILLAGISRGGFLSFAIAAKRPELAKGMLSFVGGWLSITDQWPPELNARREALQTNALRSFASRAKAPSLWIYAERDPYYSEATTRRFFEAFKDGGGNGDYVFITDPGLANGHAVASRLSLWGSSADAFLARFL